MGLGVTGIIEFFSADRIDKALGARRDWLYGNEINSLKVDVWDELARRSEQIIGDFNPTSQFWLEEWLLNYDNVQVVKTNYLDNKFLPETERARIAAAADIAITEQREQTARVVVPVTVLIVGATVAAVAWSRRPHRPAAPPAQLVLYVASHYLPGQASVDQVNGEWAVVDHERREIVPARLLLLGVES